MTDGDGADRRRLRRWSFAFAALLAMFLLWLAVRGIAWRDVVASVRHATLGPLLVALSVMSASYLVRGLRWAVLLRAEAAISSGVVIWSMLIGYLANGFLPGRAGEPIRAVLISRHSAISVSAAFATALTERIVDAMFLALIGVAGLVFVPGLPEWVRRGAWVMAAAALFGLITVLVAPRFAPALTERARRLPLSPHWAGRVSDWVGQFLRGLRALAEMERAIPFLALTLVVWCLDAGAARLVGQAVNLDLGFTQALLLIAALGLSSAAPSTPGYVGVYQFVAVSVLAPFGAAASDALVFIVAFQAIIYAIIIVGGTAGFWRLRRLRERVLVRHP